MIPREALRRVGPEWRRAAALVALGFACGVAVGIALFSVRLDMISLEREQLLVKSTDLEIQVERLQERLGKVLSGSYGPVVSEVDFVLQGMDELTRLRVRERARTLVEDLIGRRVEDLHPTLAYHLLDGRDVTVEGRIVVLRVRAVVLAAETVFWVEIEETGRQETTGLTGP